MAFELNKNTKSIIALAIILAVALAIWYLESLKPDVADVMSDIEIVTTGDRVEEKREKYEVAKEVSTPDGFINTEPITISEFIGQKVILVDFWTYSCINCQRTIPYLNAWHEKYSDKGLVIFGVHTPEFKFEEEYENVLAAVEKFGVDHPVILDNDYSTWRAYNNRYWPRKYLIDIDGFIVYDHIGEGAYEETEKKIQELLAERAQVLGLDEEIPGGVAVPIADGPEFGRMKSPEIYFGSDRNEYLANGQKDKTGEQDFSAPTETKANNLYLVGRWNIESEFAENLGKAEIIFPYEARDVYFVAGADTPVTVKVFQGEQLIKTITVKEHKLYELIENSDYTKNTLRLIIESPGLQAFTFTFG